MLVAYERVAVHGERRQESGIWRVYKHDSPHRIASSVYSRVEDAKECEHHVVGVPVVVVNHDAAAIAYSV